MGLKINTQPLEKTIEKVEADELRLKDGTNEQKYIVHFKDTKKMLVLNKTNACVIAKVLDERDALKWPGRTIRLYPTTCSCFGKTVDCIRVREE